MAVIDATKTRGKQRAGEREKGVRGGDKQSWVGGPCNDKSSSRLIYLACSHHYPGGETAN